MSNRQLLILFLLFFTATRMISQSIEAITNTVGDTAIIAIGVGSLGSGVGVHGEGYVGISGITHAMNGVGVRGRSDSGYGVKGQSDQGIGVQGSSLDGHGVEGISTLRCGVSGSSSFGSGVFGKSFDGIGVEGFSPFGYGISASSGSDAAFFLGYNADGHADIVLGGGNWYAGSDDGVIMSERGLPGSDIFLVANDAIIFEIGNNPVQNASFEIWNTDDTDVLLRLTESGNMTIKGTLSQGSDRHRKEVVTPIDEGTILHKISQLPILEWQYKGETIRHIGPMAQDFYALFQLGENETSISSIDVGGVALSAIKALKHENELLTNRLNKLETLLSAMIDDK